MYHLSKDLKEGKKEPRGDRVVQAERMKQSVRFERTAGITGITEGH